MEKKRLLVQKSLDKFFYKWEQKMRCLGVGIKMGDNVPCFILTAVLKKNGKFMMWERD